MARKQQLAVVDALASIDDATTAAAVGQATAPQAELGTMVQELLIDEILDNPDNQYQRDELRDLEELADSIRQVGILQPILVRPIRPDERSVLPQVDGHDGRWVLIAGHRRRAASALAGRTTVPAIVRTGSTSTPGGDLITMLTENVHRDDIGPIGEARSYRVLVDAGMTQNQIAKALGVSQARVSKRLSLIDLEPAVQAAVSSGRLGADVAQTTLKGLAADTQAAALQAALAATQTKSATEPTADEEPPPAPSVTASDLTRAVQNVQSEQQQEARRQKYVPEAEQAGAKILQRPPKDQYERQMYQPDEDLAKKGHLGAVVSPWGITYYDLDPNLKERKAADRDRRDQKHKEERRRRDEVADLRQQGLRLWAAAQAPSRADAFTILLNWALNEVRVAHRAVEFAVPGNDGPEEEPGSVRSWLEKLKEADRLRLAVALPAATDLDYGQYDAVDARIAEVAPELAARIAEQAES